MIRDERLGFLNVSFLVVNWRKIFLVVEWEFLVGFFLNELEGCFRRNLLFVVFVIKVKDFWVVSENDKNWRKLMGWYCNREDL